MIKMTRDGDERKSNFVLLNAQIEDLAERTTIQIGFRAGIVLPKQAIKGRL